MDRKIALDFGVEAVGKAAGEMLELRPQSNGRPYDVGPSVLGALMFSRIVQLEDRLELADRQYAGVVLALMAQGKQPIDHDKALADAVWVFRKETLNGHTVETFLEKAVGAAISAYLQHGVTK